MENIKNIITKNLIDLRYKNKLTQQELGSKINYSDKAISKWENGDVVPDIETLNKIAEVYDIDITYFFSEHNNEETEHIEKNSNIMKNIIIIISPFIGYSLAIILYIYLRSFRGLIVNELFIYGASLASLLVTITNRRLSNNIIVSFISKTVFAWTLITALYLSFLTYNIWPLFILGAPIQAILVLTHLLKYYRSK